MTRKWLPVIAGTAVLVVAFAAWRLVVYLDEPRAEVFVARDIPQASTFADMDGAIFIARVLEIGADPTPVPTQPNSYATEHQPEWRIATIEVDETLLGQVPATARVALKTNDTGWTPPQGEAWQPGMRVLIYAGTVSANSLVEADFIVMHEFEISGNSLVLANGTAPLDLIRADIATFKGD